MAIDNAAPGGEPARRPTEMDAALLSRIRGALLPYGPDAYTLEHAWRGEAEMWFIEVSPSRSDAAAFSAAFDGRDMVSITVGEDTWFEVCPVNGQEDLDYIEQIASAVFAGDIEEVRGGFARITLANGDVVSVGAAHLPVPWRLHQQIRRYVSYADISS